MIQKREVAKVRAFVAANMNIELQHPQCICQTKQFDCEHYHYNDCIHNVSILVQDLYPNRSLNDDANKTNNNKSTRIVLDVPIVEMNCTSLTTTRSLKSNNNETMEYQKHKTLCHEDSFFDKDSIIGAVVEASLWNENKSLYSKSEKKATTRTYSYSNDDDSLDNSSYSSFDIDEYSSSSDGSTTTSDDNEEDEFDLEDDHWKNESHNWSENPSEDMKSNIIPEWYKYKIIPATSPHPQCFGANWNLSRKHVRFSTITIRNLYPEYKCSSKGFNCNPKQQNEKCHIKEEEQQHQRHQSNGDSTTMLISCSCTKKNNAVLDYSSSSSSGRTMDDTVFNTDLTLDLRDYEWTKRNQRRTIVNQIYSYNKQGNVNPSSGRKEKEKTVCKVAKENYITSKPRYERESKDAIPTITLPLVDDYSLPRGR